jgi:hypothetical protein
MADIRSDDRLNHRTQEPDYINQNA